jgi:xylulokinase
MGDLFCGIDIGTTNLKVALVDGAEGRTLWLDTVATPRTSDVIGPVTDAPALLRHIEEMIERGWRAVGRGQPITAIACAGIGEDGIGLDASLAPTGHAVPWFDFRADVEAAELRAGNMHGEEAGIDIDPTRTAAKWLWLRRHRPTELEHATVWVAITDYPAVAWTGEPFMSETLAVRTACYSLQTRAFIPDLLAAAGAPALPPVLAAGAVVGTVRNGALRTSGAADADTLVIAGGHDHPVAAAVILAKGQSRRVDSLGTANLVYAEAPTGRLQDRSPLLAFGTPVRGGKGLACLGVFEFSMTVENFGIDRKALAKMLALPALPGGPSKSIPVPLKGSSQHIGERAALEACSFYGRAMLEAAAKAGAVNGPLFATGGWARSRALVQLRASVFGEVVHTVDEQELTAFGAALLASEGAGRSFTPQMTMQGTVVDPVEEWTRTYNDNYDEWRQQLDSVLR